MRYESDVGSDREFFFYSNGRELVRRARNARGPSYLEYKITELVASNYYLVMTGIALRDSES